MPRVGGKEVGARGKRQRHKGARVGGKGIVGKVIGKKVGTNEVRDDYSANFGQSLEHYFKLLPTPFPASLTKAFVLHCQCYF